MIPVAIKLTTNIATFEGIDLSKLAQADKILRKAALDGHTMIIDRVQQQGKKSDGSQIGKYSTAKLGFKAITGGFDSLSNKKQAKKRNKDFGNTSEFSGGYKEFRKSLGRQTEYVDLTLSGDMFNDYVVEPSGEREYSVGFTSEKAATISGYHEKRYGEIFTPSQDEAEHMLDIMGEIHAALE